MLWFNNLEHVSKMVIIKCIVYLNGLIIKCEHKEANTTRNDNIMMIIVLFVKVTTRKASVNFLNRITSSHHGTRDLYCTKI